MSIEGGIKAGIFLGLSEVGKIKIGRKSSKEVKKKSGTGTWRPAEKLGHFLITTTERDPSDGNFVIDTAVMDAIGPEPKEIKILFPFDDRHMNFRTSYMHYKGNKKQCEGNGQIAERKQPDGEIKQYGCAITECPHMKKGECKPSGILSCYLPDSPHRGGIYRFRTHGWNSVSGIMAALEKYHTYTDGILQGLPFKLVFTKKSTEEHGNVPVVALVLDGVELNGMRELAHAEKLARIEYGQDIALIEHEAKESGFLEDKDDEADIEEEFYQDEPDEPINEAGASSEDVVEAISEPVEPDTPENGIDPETGKSLF